MVFCHSNVNAFTICLLKHASPHVPVRLIGHFCQRAAFTCKASFVCVHSAFTTNSPVHLWVSLHTIGDDTVSRRASQRFPCLKLTLWTLWCSGSKRRVDWTRGKVPCENLYGLPVKNFQLPVYLARSEESKRTIKKNRDLTRYIQFIIKVILSFFFSDSPGNILNLLKYPQMRHTRNQKKEKKYYNYNYYFNIIKTLLFHWLYKKNSILNIQILFFYYYGWEKQHPSRFSDYLTAPCHIL